MRRGAKPAKAKVEAKFSVARKSRKNEDARGGDLEKRLAEALQREAEALEQQTATAEILRVISRSPTDVQPVLDAVAESAARLCGATDAVIVRVDNGIMRRVAHFGDVPVAFAPEGRLVTREMVTGVAMLERRTIHVADMLDEPTRRQYSSTAELARRAGFRTMLVTPLLREDTAIGAISIRRTEVRPFTDKQISLLKTFADQAVIAIENVRLFNETKEALEQQTATSEILRVIGRSQTDVQPVFDAIVANAVRLCRGNFGAVHRYDGEFLHLVAHHNIAGEALEYLRGLSPRPPGKAVRERRVVLIADFETDPDVPEAVRIGARLRGSRSNVTVPMLCDDNCLGVIVVGKRDPGLFPDDQVELLQTFADQAVIAIENVRLFTETKEALEQQTATSEILRVISSSPTEIQPVLDAVATSAAGLCEAFDAVIRLREGEELRLAAHYGPMPVVDTIPVARGLGAGRAVLERRTVHVHDLLVEAEQFPEGSENARRLGFRTALTVPLLREGAAVGTILIRRAEVRPFTDKQIRLLQTFADQAVIAIENVRLFTELQVRNRDLTEALERETAPAKS